MDDSRARVRNRRELQIKNTHRYIYKSTLPRLLECGGGERQLLALELKELSRQLAIEATRAETLARRAGPAAEDSVWPGRQSIETFGDEAVPVGVDDIAEV